MSTHTPGPWKVESVKDSDNDTLVYRRINAANGKTVGFEAGVYKTKDPQEAEANARLMAAAPELLEALQDCAIGLALYIGDAEKVKTDPTLIRARAAIAKAKGEPLPTN